MPQSLSEIRQLLSKVKPWVSVAVVLGVVVAGYYAFQGMRYYEARGIPFVGPQGKEHTQLVEIDAIVHKLAGPKPEAQVAASNLADQKLRFEKLDSQFNPREVNDLLNVLSITAEDTGLALLSISTGAQRTGLHGAAEYGKQPVILTVNGSAANISTFLRLIQQQIPVASVPSIEITGLDGAPTSRISIFFYFSKEETQEETQ